MSGDVSWATMMLNLTYFMVLTIVNGGFLVLLHKPALRWLVITYRRAGVVLLLCIAGVAFSDVVRALHTVVYLYYDLAREVPIAEYPNWIVWVAAPADLFALAFGPASMAALLLLFLKDRGVDVVANWGSRRDGLDPYDDDTQI